MAVCRPSRRLAPCEAWHAASAPDLLRHALAQIKGRHKRADITTPGRGYGSCYNTEAKDVQYGIAPGSDDVVL